MTTRRLLLHPFPPSPPPPYPQVIDNDRSVKKECSEGFSEKIIVLVSSESMWHWCLREEYDLSSGLHQQRIPLYEKHHVDAIKLQKPSCQRTYVSSLLRLFLLWKNTTTTTTLSLKTQYLLIETDGNSHRDCSFLPNPKCLSFIPWAHNYVARCFKLLDC